MKEQEKQEKTKFQGAVSLDAIFAATSGNPSQKKEQKPDSVLVKKEGKKEEGKEEREEKGNEQEILELPLEKKQINEPPIKVKEEETDSFKTAQRLIGLGMLEDFEIQSPENEELSIKVSEFKNMTEENLKELVSLQKQEKDEEISSKYLPKGNLKDHQLKVFEILSNGGDLSQIAESPEKALERPFEGFDMEDQQRQVDVRYTDLVHSKGLDHDSAITLIDKELKSGRLKDKSTEIFDMYRNAHSQYIDDILEKQKKEKEFKDLNFKENKKALTAKLKESGLKESVYKKVASEYGRKNDNGEYALIDKVRKALDDPEENHELILHLADKNLFNEAFRIKSSQETHKTIVRLASGASSKGNKASSSKLGAETQAPWMRAAQTYNDNIIKN